MNKQEAHELKIGDVVRVTDPNPECPYMWGGNEFYVHHLCEMDSTLFIAITRNPHPSEWITGDSRNTMPCEWMSKVCAYGCGCSWCAQLTAFVPDYGDDCPECYRGVYCNTDDL